MRSLDTGGYIKCRSEFLVDDEGEVAKIYVESSNVDIPEGRASNEATQKVSPFGHPRVVMDQYRLAESFIKYLFDEIRSSWRTGAKRVFFELSYEPEGGISEIEKRALRDSLEHAGGRLVTLLRPSASVSDQDIDYAYDVLSSTRFYETVDDPRVESLFQAELS